MANKSKSILWGFLLVFAFLAGGWVFKQLPNPDAPKGEVEEMYQADGEAFGIFDNIPAEDMAAAEAAAAQALGQDITLLEQEQDQEPTPSDEKINLADIVGFAPKEEFNEVPVQDEKPTVMLDLTGKEVVAVGAPAQILENTQDNDEPSRITMLSAPVKSFLIQNTQEYKNFKTRARGGYPDVNFDKQMLVVLESDSNLPDHIFEIVSAQKQDGKLLVTYRVNVFGLDKKTNTHAVVAVEKTDLPLELKQVL